MSLSKFQLIMASLFLAIMLSIQACTPEAEKKNDLNKKISQHMVTAAMSDPKTFNLVVSNEMSTNTVVGPLFEGLLRLDPDTLKPEPMLAESWEMSDDGKVWTFHIRKGVKWSDGKPLTADDVIFTFDLIYDSKVPTSIRDLLTIDGKPLKLKKLDDMTVSFALPRPFAPFLNSIMAADIMPKHILLQPLKDGHFADSWGVDTPPDQLIGAGPYKMTKYEPAQYVKYKRNPHYWMKDESGKPMPYLDEQTLLIVPDQNALYMKFTAGQTDTHSPRPEEVETLKEEAAKLNITVKRRGLDTGSPFVTFNRNPRHYIKNGKTDPKLTWFTDKHFLKAIAHSIDKETIIANTMHGLGKAAIAEISEENKIFHNPNLKDYEYDIKKAEKILADGGYKKGADGYLRDKEGNIIEFSLNTNAGNLLREQMCSIMKEDWEKLGMKVNFRPLEFNSIVEKLMSNFQWDAILISLTGGPEPHSGANVHRSSGQLHFWNPKQEKAATRWEIEMDRLVEAGASEMDIEKRKKIYNRMQEIYHEELPMILTVRQEVFTAYKRKLRNYTPTIWGLYKPERIMIAR
ncbi:MAG: ABC transporter substrate-binding protein [bacterium]|nr:ABC transporter substrate-binding protein [bacterium]